MWVTSLHKWHTTAWRCSRATNWENQSNSLTRPLGTGKCLIAEPDRTKDTARTQIMKSKLADVYLISQWCVCVCSAGTDQSLRSLEELFEHSLVHLTHYLCLCIVHYNNTVPQIHLLGQFAFNLLQFCQVHSSSSSRTLVFSPNPVWSSLVQSDSLNSEGARLFRLCYTTSGSKPQRENDRGNFCLWASLNSGKIPPQGCSEKATVF